MRGFVGNIDFEELSILRGIVPPVEEINFWRPSAEVGFRALQPGEPLLFRVKSPYNAIAGFGYFAHYSALPVSVAWEVYALANGVRSFAEMRERLLRIRNRFDIATDPRRDFWIGCILVNQPRFFEDDDFVRIPDDWTGNIVQGKVYDLTAGEGQRIWLDCLARASAGRDGVEAISDQPDRVADRPLAAAPGMLLRPRLGPRSFRIAVLDAYGRSCAVTGEKTLPVLDAAPIRDYGEMQSHAVSNGILLRADLCRLFDAGYVTVTPELRLEVSHRIREEFDDGEEYYRLQGAAVRLPENPSHRPGAETLWWHNEQRFLG
jgi:putative restriction endonuclease